MADLHLGSTPLTAVWPVSGIVVIFLLQNLMNPLMILRVCSTLATMSIRLAVAVFLGSRLARWKFMICGTSTEIGRLSTVVLVLTFLIF